MADDQIQGHYIIKRVIYELDSVQYTALQDSISQLISVIKQSLTPKYHLEGGGFVKTYAEDRPADTSAFTKPTVVDSEGGAVDPQPDFSYTFSSDKPGICDIVDNGDGTVTTSYGTAVKLPDGSYDMAELKAESSTITLPDGTTLKDVKTEQVQLVPGQAAGFAGGGFNLPDA